MQHRPAHALSWSMNTRRLMTSLSHSAQQTHHLGHRPTGAVQRPTFTQSPGCKAAFKRRSPRRFHEAPLPTPYKTCRSRPGDGAESRGCWRGRRWPPARGRIRRVSSSSFAVPQFWHVSVMLRRAELWLCWKASHFGRDGRKEGAARNLERGRPQFVVGLPFPP